MLLASWRSQRGVPRHICEDQLECTLNLVIDLLEAGPLATFPHFANVVVRCGSTEAPALVILHLKGVQALAVEVPHSPLSKSGDIRRVYRQSRRAAPAHNA